MRDVAGIDRVLEDRVELAAGEGAAAISSSLAIDPARGLDARICQLLCNQPDIAELAVAIIDVAHDGGVILDDGKAAPIGLVAQRRGSPHPHALGLGGGNLVPDPLGGDLALELGEGEQHVQGQSPHRGGSVE